MRELKATLKKALFLLKKWVLKAHTKRTIRQ